MTINALTIIADCISISHTADLEYTKLTCFQINSTVKDKLVLLKLNERIDGLVLQTLTDIGDDHTAIDHRSYKFVAITPLSDKHRRTQEILLRNID